MVLHRSKPWRHAPQQCYRLRGWRRWLMWVVFLPMAVGGLLLLGGDLGSTQAGVVLLAVSGLALAVWTGIWRHTRLEVATAGPRLHQVGYRLETPWSNVIGFHAERGHEGFVLQEPLTSRGAQRLSLFSPMSGLHAGESAGWIAGGRFIPIEAFGWHLRKGTLAADVSALAPHLAADMAAAQAPVPETARPRLPLPLWLFIGALIVGSGVLGWTQPAGVARAIDVAYALVAPLVMLQAALSTWQFARGRRWGMALLLAIATLMALAWCAVVWRQVI